MLRRFISLAAISLLVACQASPHQDQHAGVPPARWTQPGELHIKVSEMADQTMIGGWWVKDTDLAKIVANSKVTTAVIEGERNAPYSRALQIKNYLLEAGIKNIVILGGNDS